MKNIQPASQSLIGHNSVMTRHDGILSDGSVGKVYTNEAKRVWARRDMLRQACLEEAFSYMEKIQARRERFRLIKKGIIVAAIDCPPQMMIKQDGEWRPEIKVVHS